MQLLKLAHTMVRLGAPLPWAVRDSTGKLLLAQGYVLENAEQLTLMLKHGAFVDAEDARAAAKLAADQRQLKEQQQPQGVQQRPVNLFTLWERLMWQLDRALRSTEEAGFADRLREVAAQLIALTERDPDVAIYHCVRQDPKRLAIYGLSHAMHCGLVCLLVARRVGWDEARVATVVRAALTMNISTLELQGRLAVQGVSPTPTQKEQLASHPTKSVEMLKAGGVEDEDWINAVLHHHEKVDGSGYPNKVKDPGEIALMLHAVDVYMAKISPRTGRTPLTTQMAARQLFQEDQGPVAAGIVKEVGLFPPGQFVKLKSGEHAVVIRRAAHANQPLVACITDRSGMPIVVPVTKDTAKPDHAIAAAVGDNAGIVLRFPPERLYGMPE
jgi:HD-GYP domain-containing protein (c-di-GMP phosphodiesterase class II)